MAEETKAKKRPVDRARKKVWIEAVFMILLFGAIAAVISMYSAPIGIFIGVLFVILDLCVYVPSNLKRVKRCHCRECGEKYNYNRDVEWEVTDIELKERNTNPNSDKKQIVAVRIEHIDAECHCENCGAVSSFHHKFQTGVEYDNGSADVKNIETLVRRYFKA